MQGWLDDGKQTRQGDRESLSTPRDETMIDTDIDSQMLAFAGRMFQAAREGDMATLEPALRQRRSAPGAFRRRGQGPA